MNELLRYRHCSACDRSQSLRRDACTHCGSTALTDRTSCGRGLVHSVTVVTRAPSDDFRALLPYTLVLVDLVEGTRRMGHGSPGLRIGDAVEATFFTHGDRPLLRFVSCPESR